MDNTTAERPLVLITNDDSIDAPGLHALAALAAEWAEVVCVALASSLAAEGKRVLIIDADPQANATSGYGIDPRSMTSSIYECMVDDYPLLGSQVATCMKGLDLIGSRIDLAGAELESHAAFLIGYCDDFSHV